MPSPDLVFTTPDVPTIGDSTATVIDAHSVRLSASAGSPGTTTTIHFEYGTSAGYGAQSASAPVGPDGLGSVIVTGLTRSTAYHFRAVATNEFGQAVGSDRAFTTRAEQSGGPRAQGLQAGLRPAQGQVREEEAQAQAREEAMMRIRRATLGAVGLVLLIALSAVMPAAAGAETTHKFLKNISLPVNGARLMGVDPQGNVVLLAEGAVRKFSPSGEPVNFSALGTNVIDGAGGADETPWNSLGPASVAAMNHSKTGPTAGYMYVAAVKEVEPGSQPRPDRRLRRDRGLPGPDRHHPADSVPEP